MDWNPIYESPLVYPSQARNNNNKKTHQKSYWMILADIFLLYIIARDQPAPATRDDKNNSPSTRLHSRSSLFSDVEEKKRRC